MWDEAPTIVKTATDESNEIVATSASTLMSNLDSQISYWKNYSDNLESLQNRNIEGLNTLIASMDDGSQESAAALAGMATASDEELQKMVSKYGSLQDEQARTAESTGKLEIEFGEKMDDVSDKMKSTVESMDLSDEATESAKNTIDAYIAEIESGQARAAGALATLVSNAKSVLNTGTSVNIPTSTIPGYSADEGYATGTSDAAPGVALVGEEGPELIDFSGGEVVYTAEETRQILNRNYNIPSPYQNCNIPDPYVNYYLSADSGFTASEKNSSDGVAEKVITLKLEGIGSVQIGGSGGVSKEELIDFLAENLKPVLISVINDEIYEEGEDSYEY